MQRIVCGARLDCGVAQLPLQCQYRCTCDVSAVGHLHGSLPLLLEWRLGIPSIPQPRQPHSYPRATLTPWLTLLTSPIVTRTSAMAPNNNKPKDSAKTPFLQGELNDQDDNRDSFSDFESTKAQLRKRSWFKRHRNAVVIHTLMVAMNIAMAFMLWQRTWHRDRRLLYSLCSGTVDACGFSVANSITQLLHKNTPVTQCKWFTMLRALSRRVRMWESHRQKSTLLGTIFCAV